MMTDAEIQAGVDRLKPWYHSIHLAKSITTPGKFESENWNMIRRVRSDVDYAGRTVLDLATFDGMWAFEAEELGARLVVATDCQWVSIPNFMFAHSVRRSNVVPFFNVPTHELVRRLDTYRVGRNVLWNGDNPKPTTPGPNFDIIQHLGLLYHVRDPLLSLIQARSVANKDGLLLLETAYLLGEEPTMLFHIEKGRETRFYHGDFATWWAPTLSCLKDMLWASLWEPLEVTMQVLPGKTVGRCCIVARATIDVAPGLLSELGHTHRTLGLQ